MSLKDNFNQAVKEILRKDGLVGEGLKGSASGKESELMKNAVPSDMKTTGESLTPDNTIRTTAPEGYGTGYSEDARSRPSPQDFEEPARDPFSEPSRNNTDPLEQNGGYERFEYKAAEEQSAPRTAPRNDYSSQDAYRDRNMQYGGGYTPPPRTPSAPPPYRGGGRPSEPPYYETEEVSIISRNTKVNGNISSFANINIEGSVQGDVKLTKNIAVSGKVVGNIECNNAVMTGAQMQGSISSKGQVQMDHDSILLGNIDTQYLDLNGRIKGNVDVGGKAEFKNDAFIIGDITASTISVIDGAVIKGYVNTTFMQESTSNVFPEAITVSE